MPGIRMVISGIGLTLNIWECECGCQHSIGSQAELKSMSPNYADVVKKYAKEMDKEANDEVELNPASEYLRRGYDLLR